MITAKMQGRRLCLTIETDPDETPIAPYLISPISARRGREMSKNFFFVTEAMGVNDGSLGDDFTEAFGAENMKRADEEVSQPEGELLTLAAFYWQSVGGIDAVKELLEPDARGMQGGEFGQGKARAVFQLHMVPLLSQIRHHLELARQMQEESFPATATRSGSESSESKPDLPPKPPTAASQLPPSSAFVRSPEQSD